MDKNKKNFPKIWTIVINCYNSTKTIVSTLNSLNFVRNDIQVFIIDDGSTDNLKKCISKFLEKYPNTISYFRKSNGNWGSCMNFAIRKCQTKFLSVLDSDDEYVTKSFNQIANIMRRINNDVDLICANYLLVTKQNSFTTKKHISHTRREIKYMNFEKMNFLHFPTIHSTIFSVKLLKQLKPLPSNIFYSDSILLYYVMQKANWIVHLNKNIFLYKYHIFQSNQSINIKSSIRHVNDLKRVYKELLDNPVSANASKKRIAVSAKFINYILLWLIKTISQDYHLSLMHKVGILKYHVMLLKQFIDANPHYANYTLSIVSNLLNKNPVFIIQFIKVVVNSFKTGLVGATNFTRQERKELKKLLKDLKQQKNINL